MFQRVQAQFQEIHLSVRLAWLRRSERAAVRRLGREVAESGTTGGDDEVRRLTGDVEAVLARLEALRAECRLSLEADRGDMAAVPAWMRPVIAVRGLSTRAVLRYRRSAARRGLGPIYETIGARAADRAEFWHPLEREVSATRAALARVQAERERWVAPYGGSALPAWSGKVWREARGFGRSLGWQLRGHFLPKAPALVGLAVGWWVAHTYTDSHLKSALRGIGLGSGGTRVVSSSTYEAMSFWLPLLAAALCGYLGERIAAFYGEQRRQDGNAAMR
jgi:hypothetical protein